MTNVSIQISVSMPICCELSKGMNLNECFFVELISSITITLFDPNITIRKLVEGPYHTNWAREELATLRYAMQMSRRRVSS